MEKISLKLLPKDVKIELLRELGYDSDGNFVLKDGQPFPDRYTNEPVALDNMLILPGSTIIIDKNPLSIASYLEEFGDVL